MVKGVERFDLGRREAALRLINFGLIILLPKDPRVNSVDPE